MHVSLYLISVWSIWDMGHVDYLYTAQHVWYDTPVSDISATCHTSLDPSLGVSKRHWSSGKSFENCQRPSSNCIPSGWIHPGRLTAGTWEYIRAPWKRKIIFQSIMFRFELLIFRRCIIFCYMGLLGFFFVGDGISRECKWPVHRNLIIWIDAAYGSPAKGPRGSRAVRSTIAMLPPVFLVSQYSLPTQPSIKVLFQNVYYVCFFWGWELISCTFGNCVEPTPTFHGRSPVGTTSTGEITVDPKTDPNAESSSSSSSSSSSVEEEEVICRVEIAWWISGFQCWWDVWIMWWYVFWGCCRMLFIDVFFFPG